MVKYESHWEAQDGWREIVCDDTCHCFVKLTLECSDNTHEYLYELEYLFSRMKSFEVVLL